MTMTWRTFAETIRTVKLVNCCPWEIVLHLFEAAGVEEVKLPLEKTIRSWIENNRNCKVSRYFPDGKINHREVFLFFRKAPEEKLRNLQKEFKLNIDAGSPIDVNTDNLDMFCYSLVNQFLDLLGLRRIDFSNDSLLIEESIKNIHPYDKCCLYCTHWNGDKSTVGPGRISTSGICSIKINNSVTRLQKRQSSSAICTHYQVDQRLMNDLKKIGFTVNK